MRGMEALAELLHERDGVSDRRGTIAPECPPACMATDTLPRIGSAGNTFASVINLQ